MRVFRPVLGDDLVPLCLQALSRELLTQPLVGVHGHRAGDIGRQVRLFGDVLHIDVVAVDDALQLLVVRDVVPVVVFVPGDVVTTPTVRVGCVDRSGWAG